MSIAAWLLIEYLVTTWLDYMRRRWAARRQAEPDAEQDGDGEPVLDFDEVRDDVERLLWLMREGRTADAREACQQLLDRMNGIDDAAATDFRWHEWQQARGGAAAGLQIEKRGQAA